MKTHLSFKWLKVIGPAPLLFFLFMQSGLVELRAQGEQDRGAEQETGLVLAGGGALGLAHVGVLEYLEELNISIDRIGGTSMGGIISGLYALGYDAAALKEIALSTDWDYLLSNEFDRTKAPLLTKNYPERYLLSLARSKNQIGFTSAFIDGINIYQFLQWLTFPNTVDKNFEELPIPFYCIAVDLKKGKEVIQDNGHLPDALLSTMTIPAVFNPVEQDSFLLVDGGVLNNFPVKEIRRRGADLVIGVRLITANEEQYFGGPFEVLGRTFDIVTEEARKQYEGDCDICIDVPLQGYSVADFNKADSLVAIGKRAAQKYRSELMALSKRRKSEARPKPIQQTALRQMELTLEQVSIQGNEYVPERYIRNTLKLKEGKAYQFSEIQEGIERLQAVQQFKGIRYNFLQEGKEGTTMQVEVTEKEQATFNLGANYNSDFGLSLLLHPQLRNWGGFGNTINMELRISRNPFLRLHYIGNSNGLFSPFGSLQLLGEDYFDYTTDTDFSDEQNNLVEAKAGIQWNPAISFAMGAGVEWQWYGFTEKAQQLIFDDLSDHLLNYLIYVQADYLDKRHFPGKGFEIDIIGKRITDDFSNYEGGAPQNWLFANYSHYFPFSSDLTFSIGGQLGYGSGQVDRQYLFYQGGLFNHLRQNAVIQAGMPFMRNSGRNVIAFQGGLRWDLTDFHHFSFGYTQSRLSQEMKNIFDGSFEQGIFLAYGYGSIFGPLELQAGTPIDSFDFQFYLSAGFRF